MLEYPRSPAIGRQLFSSKLRASRRKFGVIRGRFDYPQGRIIPSFSVMTLLSGCDRIFSNFLPERSSEVTPSGKRTEAVNVFRLTVVIYSEVLPPGALVVRTLFLSTEIGRASCRE